MWFRILNFRSSFVLDFWDTAGQERFQSMHASYYHQAHSCILVFDVTRKVTYKNLPNWYKELREKRPEIPCLCAANKIDGKPNRPTLRFQNLQLSHGARLLHLFVSL